MSNHFLQLPAVFFTSTIGCSGPRNSTLPPNSALVCSYTHRASVQPSIWDTNTTIFLMRISAIKIPVWTRTCFSSECRCFGEYCCSRCLMLFANALSSWPEGEHPPSSLSIASRVPAVSNTRGACLAWFPGLPEGREEQSSKPQQRQPTPRARRHSPPAPPKQSKKDTRIRLIQRRPL